MFRPGISIKYILKLTVAALFIILSLKKGSEKIYDSIIRVSSTANTYFNKFLKK